MALLIICFFMHPQDFERSCVRFCKTTERIMPQTQRTVTDLNFTCLLPRLYSLGTDSPITVQYPYVFPMTLSRSRIPPALLVLGVMAR